MEALLGEQPVGGLDEVLASPGLPVGAGQGCAHTVSIRIPTVFVKC